MALVIIQIIANWRIGWIVLIPQIIFQKPDKHIVLELIFWIVEIKLKKYQWNQKWGKVNIKI